MEVKFNYRKRDITQYLSEMYGRPVTKSEAERMMNVIPRKLFRRENMYILKVNTYKEYHSYLYLFDKVYSSKLHQYGEQETLLYSLLKDVRPGIVKEHRIRNSSGRFENHKSSSDPVTPYCDRNIVIIKSEIWDSLKEDKEKIIFTILIYNKDLNIPKTAL